MGCSVRRYYMEKDFSEVIKETTPKQTKSLMWYVGCIVATGIAGIVAMLFLLEVVFV